MYRIKPSSVGDQCASDGSAKPTRATEESTARSEADIAVVGDTSVRAASAEQIHQTATKTWIGVALLAWLFVWSFWHTMTHLWGVWQNKPDYSAGQLVPLAAVYMVFVRRRVFTDWTCTFSAAGFALFGVGLTASLLGGYYFYASLQNLGLVVCLNGLALTFLGWHVYKRLWYPLLFLFLMVPLPNRIHDAVMLPLQGFCARASAAALEVIGLPVTRFGHVLDIGNAQIAVAEACNGLRMALAFLIVAGVMVCFVRQPRWQKGVVLLSSVPIAIVCNVFRIVATACLYGTRFEWIARGTTHEMAGLLMMPLAVGLIVLELRLLASLSFKYRIGHAGNGHRRVPLTDGAA